MHRYWKDVTGKTEKVAYFENDSYTVYRSYIATVTWGRSDKVITVGDRRADDGDGTLSYDGGGEALLSAE